MNAQNSLYEQLKSLYVLANKEGLYDAADWLYAEIKKIEQKTTEHNCFSYPR